MWLQHRSRIFSSVNNSLIARFEPELSTLLAGVLEPVEFPAKFTLLTASSPIDYIYFLDAGLVSIIVTAGGERLEVGLVGFDGVVGSSGLLAGSEILLDAVAISAVRGRRLPIDVARQLSAERPAFFGALTRFLQIVIMQMSHTTLSIGRGTVEKRLARWLLMVHDRLEGDELALTHDFMATLMGVRRPMVTVALHVMEGEGALRSRRNSLTILDRAKLRALAGPTYGYPESLHERLFGDKLSKG